VDLSPAMIDEARRKVPREAAARVRFEVGDASALTSSNGAFDLVVLSNMIPFFDELARVTAPGGTLVLSFSRGDETPIYVSSERRREELGKRRFAEFAEFSAEPATALRAKRQ
ncbi:MAG TPA: class I SAM-dependent methyltransferase, partial [Gaiellaceae bacterium]|nr:class I SAM-dependent methyltransferase [Gaiellaceae bacterium]